MTAQKSTIVIKNYITEHNIEMRVRFQETDQMGVVYHGNYFSYFEMGRTELLRAQGISYREMSEAGFMTAIVKAECQYKRPAKYDDLLTLKTKLIKVTRIKIEHEYFLYRGEELLAVGHTVLAAVNADGTIGKLPDSFMKFAEY